MNIALIKSAFNGIFVDEVFVPNDSIDEMTFICDCCGERHLRGRYDENVYAVDNGDELCERCAEDETFVCERCGERHYNDDCYRVNTSNGYEEYWCDDCTSYYATRCIHCDEYFEDGTMTDVTGYGDYVCESCLEDYAECEVCGELHETRYMTQVYGGGYVCDDCLDDNYTYDYSLGAYISNDEYSENCGVDGDESADGFVDSNTRPRSENAVRRSYHSRPTWWNVFMGAKNALNNTAYKGVGVELEVDMKSGECAEYMQRALNRIDRITNSNRVYFNADCSLNDGFEIISRPHTLEAFDEIPWADIMAACTENGFSSHDAGTCGLHFHFSRLMFGDDEETQDDNISKLVQFFEFYWDDIVKVSRREANQLGWCNKKGYVSKKRIKEYVKDKRGGHSEAINNSNADTVEIRVMRGTLNIDTFNASLDLLVTLIKNACRIDWDEVCEAEEMLKGIKAETADYLMRKNAFYREAYNIRYNG